MQKHPFDLLDWQKRLRELAGHKPESEWPDPALNKIEDKILGDASKSASEWLYSVWVWAARALERRTEASFDDFDQHTEETTIDAEKASQKVVVAFRQGIERAGKQLKLAPKGPWVEVPHKPSGTRYEKRLTLPKQAEWIARQSAASKMREWADGMKEDVRWQVVQAIREGISPSSLAERLQKRWVDYGSRMQTIAATEMGMAYNDAVLTHLADDYVVVPTIEDDKVCKDCKRLIEGKVFWVSLTPIQNPTKQEYEQYVWPGKSNVGRLKENWWPCVPLHPNCRHVYVKYRGGDPYSYKSKPNGR